MTKPKAKTNPPAEARWFTIGCQWREVHATIQHGDLIRITDDFAGKTGAYGHRKGPVVKPNTLRGYRAAADLVLRLEAEKLIDGAQAKKLAATQLKVISVLQRVARLGQAALGEVLFELRSKEPPTRAGLEALEEEIRARNATSKPTKNANAHSFRLRASAAKTEAVKAWRALASSEGRPSVELKTTRLLPPFQIDAVALDADGTLGMRFVAETAEATKVRLRLDEIAVQAIAAARALASILLVTQSRDDATKLVNIINLAGDCGVGVSHLQGDLTLQAVLQPARTVPPDLAQGYAAIIGALPIAKTTTRLDETTHGTKAE